MSQKARFSWLFIPLVIYLALMGILYVERSGVSYQVSKPSLQFLDRTAQPVESKYTDPPVESLVLYDSSVPAEGYIHRSMEESLDYMRVRYTLQDTATSGTIDYQKYKTVVVALQNLDRLNNIQAMLDWVKAGGRVMFVTCPEPTGNFNFIYRKLGILSTNKEQINVLGVAFTSDLFPGAKGMRLEGEAGGFLSHASYPVQLEPTTRVHITSADDYNQPLLWDNNYGKGRFVVINTNEFSFRVNRGILGAAYSLLQDVFVYPVINSSVYFIDDFPAPMPDGSDPVIAEEFKTDTRNFLINIWWPDMEKLAKQYGIKYTGLLIESYDDKVSPPFNQVSTVDDHRYVGSLLLRMGGEIGLHGYNHVPLCTVAESAGKSTDYHYWPSVENQQQAVKMLQDFSQKLFPENYFTAYVPPSNILCPEARKWLPSVLPNLKVISSLFVEDEGTDEGAYTQEFKEASDGIIEFPRIVSGYFLYENMQLALINELGLQYVNSYFIHPDDILDPLRREDRTWAQMKEQFTQQVKWLYDNAPGLRSQTVDEGAAAVQRYGRLKVNAVLDQDVYTIHLGGFYDEASLMLRSSREPVGITGGKITKVNSSMYLIEANQPEIKIQLRK